MIYLNWLTLIAFAALAIPFARWAVRQSLARWEGPDTVAAFAFMYALTMAAIGGLSYLAALVLYAKIFLQPEFMILIGLVGAIKFLLMFSGVWYGMLYMIQAKYGGAKP